jgi:hypothetical protein
VPQALWYPASPAQGTLHLVDCRGKAAALRHPYRVAYAYLRRHPRTVYPFGTGNSYYEDTSGFASRVRVLLGGRPGNVTVLIGPTSRPSQIAYAGPGGVKHDVTFALPANWYFQIQTSHQLVVDTVFETFARRHRS